MVIAKQPYLIYAEVTPEPAGNRGENLIASIRFGDGEKNLLLGVVRFRVSEVYLTMKCEKCALPSDHWLFRDHVTRSLSVQFTVQEGFADSTESNLSVSAQASDKPSISSSASEKESRGFTNQRSAMMTDTLANIHAQGGPKSPRWLIKAPIHSTFLQGTLCDVEPFALADLEGETSGTIRTSFKIPRHGLSFSLGNQIAGQHPNKAGLIKHIIRLLYTEREYTLPEIKISR